MEKKELLSKCTENKKYIFKKCMKFMEEIHVHCLVSEDVYIFLNLNIIIINIKDFKLRFRVVVIVCIYMVN